MAKDLTWATITRERFEKLVADIATLCGEYAKAAGNPDNQAECMYGDVCGEVADALHAVIEGRGINSVY